MKGTASDKTEIETEGGEQEKGQREKTRGPFSDAEIMPSEA